MAEEHELTWRLSDPGMDLLERAGLAGLYMALRAATETGTSLSPLTWCEADLKPDSLTVRWSGPAEPAFIRLMEWAWQVCDGILYLPAVHDERDRVGFQYRVPSHSGIMRTFLQHVNTQPKLDSVTRVVQLDETKRVTVSFEPPAERVEDHDRPINPKTNRLHKKKVGSDRVRPLKMCEVVRPNWRFFAPRSVLVQLGVPRNRRSLRRGTIVGRRCDHRHTADAGADSLPLPSGSKVRAATGCSSCLTSATWMTSP